jgi:hypothetical protein
MKLANYLGSMGTKCLERNTSTTVSPFVPLTHQTGMPERQGR